MRLAFFTIPVFGDSADSEDMNRILASHRVISVDRHLVQAGSDSAWAVCISYIENSNSTPPARRSRIDYREILPEDQFAVFAKLRALRKELAHAQGVPVYALFTNEQLAAMVQRKVRSTEDMLQIEGVGPAKVKKFGSAVLELLNSPPPVSDAPDADVVRESNGAPQ